MTQTGRWYLGDLELAADLERLDRLDRLPATSLGTGAASPRRHHR